MTFGSVCSGILGAELAWEPLGWKPLWCAEIDRFPCAVIAHHRKELPNLGDFTKLDPPPATVDVFAGGTPCQSVSSSGKRDGMDDPRGQLAFQFAELASRVGARWVVWENVRGSLSANDGRFFGVFLGALASRGYHCAYRVLDAKYWHLAQQRERVFVVGYLGDWRPPAAVLFEPPSLQRYPHKGQPSGTPFARPSESGIGKCCTSRGPGDLDPTKSTYVAHTLGEGRNNLEGAGAFVAHTLGAGRGNDDGIGAFIAFDKSQITSPHNRSNPQSGGNTPTLTARGDAVHVARTLRARHDSGGDPSRDTWIDHVDGVRKLTPLEYERLQGFPDNWTKIPGCSDSARYKAIGNAWPVPVARWIGERIQMVEEILRSES